MTDAPAPWHSTDAAFAPAQLEQGRIVLFFYPKDATSGCTLEVQQFRDLYPEFTQRGWQVIGVSRDSLRSHQRFIAAQQLPFALISDAQEVLCQRFDVIRDKVMYGKPARGLERSTFLLQDGQVLREWRKVKADGHAAVVLAALPE